MNKEEIIKMFTDKSENSKEVEEMCLKFEKDADDFGISDTNKMGYLKTRLLGYFNKKKENNVQELQCILVGVSHTDFGATRQYKEAIKLFKSDKYSAITKRITTADGEPLYQNGMNVGKPIDMDKVFTATYHGLLKHNGKFKHFTLVGKNEFANTKLPLFKMLDIKTAFNESKMTCKLDSVFSYLENKTLTYDQVKLMVKENFVSNILSNITDEKIMLQKTSSRELVVLKGDLNVSENSLTLNVDNNSTALYTNDLNKDVEYIDGALEVIIFGTVGKKSSEDVYFISLLGMIADDNFKIPKIKKIEELEESNKKEEAW